MNKDIVLVLDNIRSMHNVGSIFRTADGAGCKKIELCGYTPGPVNKFRRINTKLTKVALGAEKTIAWEHHKSALDVVDQLQQQGVFIIALEQHKRSINVFDMDASQLSAKSVALVLGNEREGVQQQIIEQVDLVVEIPMYGSKTSLNVAVACGIAVYHMRRLETLPHSSHNTSNASSL
jgi:23S rRNA (guanosine2251-2'-O)-methyltransferase